VFVSLMISVPGTVGAGQLGTQIPSNCVAHTSFDGGADLRDDFRCAGLAIQFHTAGVAFSPGLIWAGQWLFTDETGQFRVGSCTFNRGIHPTIDAPSFPVAQLFPNDPTGAKGAYLTWGYGDTTDNLTAAAMWAVFHYYAQDAAGTRRATNGAVPLIPSLGMIARASGRSDVQALAIALDAEAAHFAGEWAISITLGIDGRIDVAVFAGAQPVLGARVTLLISGQDAPTTVETDVAGLAHSTMPVAPGTMTVVASTSSPGLDAVYRGSPAGPDPQGAQRLVTGGPPRVISATATAEVPTPETTTTTTTIPETTTTTTVPETTTTTTTTIPETTTTTTIPDTTTTITVPETTSTTSTTLPPETTSTTTPIPPTEVQPTTIPPDTTAPALVTVPEVPPTIPGTPLPKTGKGSDLISYLGTSLLVAGIGIVGVASRRPTRRRLAPLGPQWPRADRS
jgi:LPXTG-motif cell wall-anchored protein